MPLFGEIIEPSSRALFCDDSSEDEEHSETKLIRKWELSWCGKDGMPTSISNMLVFQGRLALEFVRCNILKDNESEIGEIREISPSDVKPAHSRPGRRMSINKLSSETVACLCPEVDYDDCNIILDALLPLLSKSKQVTLIMSCSAPLFKCSDPSLDLPSSFMRVLYSASFKGQEVIAPILEQPNIVTGVAAAVLSWCEVFNVPGCLYICYSDSEKVDSISAEPIIQIFSKLFRNIVNMSDFVLKRKVHESASNLYM